MSITIKFIQIDSDLPAPKFALPGDAACDLLTREVVTIAPGEKVQIGTGLKVEIPEGFAGFIWDKSGISQKSGLKTLGGVIDSSFRGEIMVGMINLSQKAHTFEKGQKVAQMCIQKIEVPIFEHVETLSDTSRGDKGFGSTGK